MSLHQFAIAAETRLPSSCDLVRIGVTEEWIDAAIAVMDVLKADADAHR